MTTALGESIWSQGHTVVTPPAEEPVSLAALRRWCFVEGTDPDADAELTEAALTARVFAEKWCNRALVTQTHRLTMDGFPSGSILLPVSPLISIAAVRYYTADVLTTLAGTEYAWDETREPGWLLPSAAAGAWPDADDRENGVEVDFICGFGAASAVPSPFKTAIKIMAKHLYDGREAATLPDAFFDLLYTWRVLI